MNIDPRLLKTVIKETTIYPNRKANTCEMVNSDNTIYKTDVLVDEVNLALYLKAVVFPKLTNETQSKLLKLINEYGHSRYEDGDVNANLEF